MRKRTSRVLAAALAGMMLVGCGTSQPAATEAAKDNGGGQTEAAKTEDTKSTESGDKVTLELYLQKTDVVDIFQEMIGQFEEKNPDIHIEPDLCTRSGDCSGEQELHP